LIGDPDEDRKGSDLICNGNDSDERPGRTSVGAKQEHENESDEKRCVGGRTTN
jgi:hypothetical protein